jgi:hypothetical protein
MKIHRPVSARPWAASLALGLALTAVQGLPAAGQIAVSANDGKQLRGAETAADLRPDEIVTLDLARSPPRIVGRARVHTSMIGPPTSVAVSRDGRRALVSASLALPPIPGQTLEPGRSLSLVDLSRPRRPVVLQSLPVGPNLSGVSISDDGRLALAVSAGDAVVHLFAVGPTALTALQDYGFGPEDRAIDADIGPDNRTVIVALQNRGTLARLAVRNGRLESDGAPLDVGLQPYGVLIDREGRYAYVPLLGGRRPAEGAASRPPGPRMGAVAVVDLAAWSLKGVFDVGITPEHVALSPDGRHLAVVLINGSNSAPGSANYRDFGWVKVLKVEDGRLSELAEARTGGWCQGATWSADARRLFVQCTTDRVIEVFTFDGQTLAPSPVEALGFSTRPGAIATAQTR